ncbi:hypothetical protein BBJ28_00012278 [Nothophytophthora sp. Chile5]|nr:hypothetical protein BBJ28_00012278 [Nothophytophthora sp. Chile5]
MPPSASQQQQQTLKTASSSGNGSSTRKRVFTFQKRWLHSLPIVERSLPDTSVDGRVLKAVRAGLDDGDAEDSEKQKDVIVCMLCDDPASKRELTKVWSRLNCRRGRIENHLMSKHPEFMLLLKHKREAEGDLVVQLFLENMRHGHCNVRNEINVGLYSQLQSSGGGNGANAAMRSAVAAAATGTRAADDHSDLQKRAFGDYNSMHEPPLDLESLRKRAKLATLPGVKDSDPRASLYSAGSMMMLRSRGIVPPSIDSDDAAGDLDVVHKDADGLVHGQSVIANKLVVITGGDSPFMANVATHLWLSGANVLLTFTKLSALDAFNANHLARYSESTSEGVSSPPRGVLVPMLRSFETREHVDDWSRSIAEKFHQVDVLINYFEPEKEETTAVNSDSAKKLKQEEAARHERSEGSGQTEASIFSSGFVTPIYLTVLHSAMRRLILMCVVLIRTLLMALCQSLSSVCFSTNGDAPVSASGGSIINLAAAEDDSTLEALTKSLAAELQPRNAQVNCILVHPWQSPDTPDPTSSPVDPSETPERMAALSHAMMFLLSPWSRLLSGSVLRLQQAKPSSIATAAASSNRVVTTPSTSKPATMEMHVDGTQLI